MANIMHIDMFSACEKIWKVAWFQNEGHLHKMRYQLSRFNVLPIISNIK